MSDSHESSKPASTSTNNTGSGQGGYLNTSNGTNSPLCYGGTSDYSGGGHQFFLGAPLEASPITYAPTRKELKSLQGTLKAELNIANAAITEQEELEAWRAQNPDGYTAGNSDVATGIFKPCSSCKKSKKRCSRASTGLSPCDTCKDRKCACN